MVARRLATMTGKAEIGEVRQILDVGSWHLGQSIEFANIFPTARIDAFEPAPDSYQLCVARRDSLQTADKNRIRVHQLALSNKSGKVPFYAVDTSIKQKIDAGFSSLLKFNGGLKNSYYDEKLVQKEITVQADTLDNWCKKNKITRVDIMWVDAQGTELMVFQGAKNILKNTRIIMTEVGLKPYYEGHTLKADIDKYLARLGFRELECSFELNGFDYEANTIYVK